MMLWSPAARFVWEYLPSICGFRQRLIPSKSFAMWSAYHFLNTGHYSLIQSCKIKRVVNTLNFTLCNFWKRIFMYPFEGQILGLLVKSPQTFVCTKHPWYMYFITVVDHCTTYEQNHPILNKLKCKVGVTWLQLCNHTIYLGHMATLANGHTPLVISSPWGEYNVLCSESSLRYISQKPHKMYDQIAIIA